MGLSNVLTIDYAKLTNQQIGYVDLDAAACFDRMIRSLSIVAFVHYGEHPHFAIWYLTLLHHMRHYIITAYGVDEDFFPPLGIDIEGIGQGSTIAGHAWKFIDSFITTYYKRLVLPLKCACPMQEYEVKKA